MKRWLVVTPSYPYTEIIEWEIGGPTYDVADVIEIEAETKRDAIGLGVVEMLRRGPAGGYAYCIDQRSEGLCPYDGVYAEKEEQ